MSRRPSDARHAHVILVGCRHPTSRRLGEALSISNCRPRPLALEAISAGPRTLGCASRARRASRPLELPARRGDLPNHGPARTTRASHRRLRARALASWERFHRSALESLAGHAGVRDQPRVMRRPTPTLERSVSATSSVRHAAAAATAAPVASFGRRSAAGSRRRGRRDDKDEGLAAGQPAAAVASLLEQLLGTARLLRPDRPRTRVALGRQQLLDLRRDLDQVWKALDWATAPARIPRSSGPSGAARCRGRPPSYPRERHRGPPRLPPVAARSGASRRPCRSSGGPPGRERVPGRT